MLPLIDLNLPEVIVLKIRLPHTTCYRRE